jgi:WD40 repeat protein
VRDEKVDRLARLLESGESLLISPRRAARRLARAGTPDAVRALAEELARSRDYGGHEVARRALARLDDQGAIDAVCQVWSYRRSDELDRLVEQNGWIASHPPYVRVRTALRVGRPDVLGGDELTVQSMVGIADGDRDPELRARAAAALAGLGTQEAREHVCAAAIEAGSAAALDAAVAGGFAPKDPGRRAVLLFLTEQLDAYGQLDFDGRLLRAAHEAAEPHLRARLAAVARKTGRLDWVRAVTLDRSDERLAALSDDEWDTSRATLVGARRWADLWRLALAAPPLWAVRVLRDLGTSGWRPQPAAERADREALIGLAERCDRYPVDRLLLDPEGARAVRALAVSDDGEVLAAGDDNGVITVWELPEVRRLLQIDASPGTVTSIVIGDGALVAAGSAAMTSWRLRDGAQLARAYETRANLLLAPDGTTLFSMSYDGKPNVWEWPTLRKVRTAEDFYGSLSQVVATPGRELAAGLERWGIRVWELPSGRLLERIGGNGPLALAPDGSLLAGTPGQQPPPPAQRGDVALWHLPSGDPAGTLTGHAGNITSLTITPDGGLLASAGREGTVRLWRLPSGEPAGVLDVHERPVSWDLGSRDEVGRLTVTADSRFLVAGSRNGRLRTWRLPSGEPADAPEGLGAEITSLAVTPGGYAVAASNAGSLRLWQPAVLSQARTPAGRLGLSVVEQLRATAGGAGQPWVELMERMAGRRHRYDVEIDDGSTAAAATDIELRE